MRAENESRLVLAALAIAVTVLLLLVLSLGAVLLVSQSGVASDVTVTPSTGPGTLATTEPPADADQLATSPSRVPPATSLPPATISPTTPTPAVPVVTRTPAVAPTFPILTPTVPTLAESVVTAPSAFVYDKPIIMNSVIGGIQRDDKIVILGSSGTWYLIRVSSTNSARSKIEGGQGWIVQDAVSPPSKPVPEITP